MWGRTLLRKCGFMTEEQLKVATLVCRNTFRSTSPLSVELRVFWLYVFLDTLKQVTLFLKSVTNDKSYKTLIYKHTHTLIVFPLNQKR